MEIRPRLLRTPDARFDGLPDYAFAPHHVDVADADLGSLRMHYVDEGPRDAPVVLMLHGNPTWSYLYRHMIGPVADAGYRVIAPDMIGFGKSDKPAARGAYGFDRFVGWMRAFVAALDLRDITLVCQDWGGPIGLRVLSDMPDRFAAVLATNTLLQNCDPPPLGVAGWPGEAIAAWIGLCRTASDLPVSEFVASPCVTRPADAVLAAYDAPFPDESYKEGARQFPALVPVTPEHASVAENLEAWKVLERFERPLITAFSDGDPITKGGEAPFQARVPGAQGQPHVTLHGGHFLQEDSPDAIVEVIAGLITRRG